MQAPVEIPSLEDTPISDPLGSGNAVETTQDLTTQEETQNVPYTEDTRLDNTETSPQMDLVQCLVQ